jgi:hypothetical protein
MERRRRIAPRPALLLACAVAVPAMLLAGCSSGGSGGDGEGSGDSASTEGAPTTPSLAPAKYGSLPDACTTVSRATVTALVPKAKAAGGTPAKADESHTRSGCSWTGNGSDGYQYRWLSVTLQRFTSTPAGSAEERAEQRYTDQIAQLRKAPGASTSAITGAGTGDQAGSVTEKATVAKVTSQNDTVVARTGNIVVIVEYNGAGLEGKKNPTASDVRTGAERAVKDAIAAVVGANG